MQRTVHLYTSPEKLRSAYHLAKGTLRTVIIIVPWHASVEPYNTIPQVVFVFSPLLHLQELLQVARASIPDFHNDIYCTTAAQ